MKNVILYHGNCSDGSISAYIAWKVFGDSVEYFPMDHSDFKDTLDNSMFKKVLPEIDNYKEYTCYLLDFSFTSYHLSYLMTKFKKIVIIDHHKTTFEMYSSHKVIERDTVYNAVIGNVEFILDNSKSGAYLTWEYFFKIPPPLWVKFVSDRDLFTFKYSETNFFYHFLKTLKKDNNFIELDSILNDNIFLPRLDKYLFAGETILNDYNNDIDHLVKNNLMECVIKIPEGNTYYGHIINSNSFYNGDLGKRIYESIDTDFVLLWSLSNDGTVLCSLRSKECFDTTKISKSYGGGGHKNASGFTTDLHTLNSWLIKKMKL